MSAPSDEGSDFTESQQKKKKINKRNCGMKPSLISREITGADNVTKHKNNTSGRNEFPKTNKTNNKSSSNKLNSGIEVANINHASPSKPAASYSSLSTTTGSKKGGIVSSSKISSRTLTTACSAPAPRLGPARAAFKSPLASNSAGDETTVQSTPLAGLRLGLSRKSRYKSLHPNASVK